MTQLSREMLIQIQAQGGDYAASQIKDVQSAIEGVETATNDLGVAEQKTAGTLRRSFVERMRQNKEYQALNKATNGQLDQMVQKAELVRGKLSDMSAIRMGSLAAGLGYVSYQLGRIDSAGSQVNKSLDQMGIKLSATIKQARGLSSITEAKAQSQQYIDWARQYAANTPFEQTEVIGAMSNLAPVFKGDLKKIKSAVEAATVLAQIDPVQGFEGAVYAIREAASGSTMSLSSRFEISKSQLNRHLKGGPNANIGEAIKAALKENGQTMEMVEQFSTTIDGMESNLSDSRNYIAGQFNKPIFEARKQGMYFKQDQMKRYTQGGAGMDSGMSALGQFGGMLTMGGNLLYQGIMRPANAQRLKLLDALAPGMIQAKAAMEESTTKMEINDLEARFDQLTGYEHQRLKDLRKRLREIPIEARKAQRSAELYIDKSANYIASALGLSGREKDSLVKWMKDTSKSFVDLVDRAKKALSDGRFRSFIKGIVDMGKSLRDALVDGPKELYRGLKANGVLDTFKEAMIDISRSLGELGIKVGGTGQDTVKLIANTLNATILGVTKVITLLSIVLKPVIFFLKGLIMGTLGVAKFVADVVDRLVQGGSSLVEKALRLMGKNKEADEIAANAKEMKFQRDAGGNIVVPAGTNPAAPKGYGQNSSTSTSNTNTTPANKAAQPGIAERISNWFGNQQWLGGAGAAVGAALTAAGVYGMGQNVRNTWTAGRASGGFLGGVRALGTGAFKMFDVGGPGVRESFKPGNLLRARGIGGTATGVALNTLLPGSPVTILYNIMLGYQTIKYVLQLMGKWTKGGFATTGRVIKDFFSKVGNGLKSIVNPSNWKIPGFDKLANLVKNGVKGATSGILNVFSSLRGFFVNLGTKIAGFLPQLFKIPVIGPLVQRAATALGIAGAGLGAAASVPAQVTGAVSYYGTRLAMSKIKVDGKTLDERTQNRMMRLAASSPLAARAMGIGHDAAKDYVRELDKQEKAAREKKKSKTEIKREQIDSTRDVMTDSTVINSTAIFASAVMQQMGIPNNQQNKATGVFAPGAGSGSIGGITGGKKVPVSKDKQAMFKKVMEAARAAGDPHPEVTAAQWALESGWGAKESGKNNLFGIKARPGEKGTVRTTTEYINGKKVQVQAKFKDFDTLEDGVRARVELLKSKRYANAGYGTATTSEEAIRALVKGGYATDPNYAKLLLGVMGTAGLRGGIQRSANGGLTMQFGDTIINGKTKEEIMKNLDLAQAEQRKSVMAALNKEVK